MNRSLAALLIFLLVAALPAPAAAAPDQVCDLVSLCIEEEGDGVCTPVGACVFDESKDACPGGRSTTVEWWSGGPVYLHGGGYFVCRKPDWSDNETVIFLEAGTSVLFVEPGVHLQWYDAQNSWNGHCGMYVVIVLFRHEPPVYDELHPCYAGSPPDPGWGRLLP